MKLVAEALIQALKVSWTRGKKRLVTDNLDLERTHYVVRAFGGGG